MRSSRFSKALVGSLGLALVLPFTLASSETPAAASPTTSAAGGQGASPTNAAPGQGTSFQNLNGFMWFYNVSPQNGTLQDWKNLVAAAHREGIKVVSYFVGIYMDENSSYFKTAETQYAAGDRTSREVSSFDWTTNPNDPLPRIQSGPP